MKIHGIFDSRFFNVAPDIPAGAGWRDTGQHLADSLLRRAHQPYPPVTTVYVTPSAPAPSTMTFAARLYPANDVAAAYGMVNAIVTNDLNGRGIFTTNINGETFNGEATRVGSGSARTGVANGAGNRGGYINCNYQMNNATLGTGQCKLSNGALFTMHVGN